MPNVRSLASSQSPKVAQVCPAIFRKLTHFSTTLPRITLDDASLPADLAVRVEGDDYVRRITNACAASANSGSRDVSRVVA